MDEIDKIKDWIEKIVARNKVMEGFYEDIQKLKDQTQEQFLEAKKYYSDAFLDIS